MSDLGAILAGKLAAASVEVPVTGRDLAQASRRHYGSNRAAARALGVDEKTIRRYLSGETRSPKAGTLDRIARTLRAARVDVDRVRAGLQIKWKYDDRVRTPTFVERRPGQPGGSTTLKPGTVEKIADAYARGDRDGMARAFLGGLDDGKYGDMFGDAYENPGEAAGEGSDSVGAFVA